MYYYIMLCIQIDLNWRCNTRKNRNKVVEFIRNSSNKFIDSNSFFEKHKSTFSFFIIKTWYNNHIKFICFKPRNSLETEDNIKVKEESARDKEQQTTHFIGSIKQNDKNRYQRTLLFHYSQVSLFLIHSGL